MKQVVAGEAHDDRAVTEELQLLGVDEQVMFEDRLLVRPLPATCAP